MILRAAAAVFVKDLRTEWRTRVALNALLLFAFSVLILVGYAVGPTRLSIEDRPVVNSVLLWIVLFFSAMTGLSRAFVNEEETGTALALRLSAPPSAVFLGKLLSNLALLGVVMAFVVPLFLGLMSFGIASPGLFLALCGLLGFTGGYWAIFITIAAEQFGTNIRATVATTVPNFVRGLVVVVNAMFLATKGSFGLAGAAAAVGAVWFTAAIVAAYGLRETFGIDLDYVEPD